MRGKGGAVAHYVKVGASVPKVRNALGVFGLGLITLGFYSVWWWYRTWSDLAAINASDDGHETIRPAREATMLALAMYGLAVVAVATSKSLPETANLVQLASLAIWLGLARRMWSTSSRTMTRLGLLPEEKTSPVGFWIASVLLGLLGGSAVLQAALNKVWRRYPQYYPSIGGTREEVLGVAQPASTGALAHVATSADWNDHSHAAGVIRDMSDAAAAGTLDARSAFLYAQAVETVHGAAQAAPWYEFVANSDEHNAAAAMWVGAFKLRAGDDAGLRYLYEAAHDPAFREHASALIARELDRLGHHEEAASWRRAIA